MAYGDDRVGPDLDPETRAAVFAALSEALTAGPLPQFGSHEWCQLDEWDVRRYHAALRAALAWWTAEVFGPDAGPDRLVNLASKDVAGADPALWRRLASDRAAGIPVGRDRLTGYVSVPPPRANTDLEAAFERAGREAK